MRPPMRLRHFTYALYALLTAGTSNCTTYLITGVLLPSLWNIFEGSCLDFINCSECHSKFGRREGSVFKGRIKVGADSVSLAELYGQEAIGPQFK